jgi:hypothetical protein
VGRSEVSDPPVLVHRLIAWLNTGGPAIHVVHLAEALDATRFRTRLITGRITEIIDMSRLLSPLGDLPSFLTLLRLFRRERTMIVHPHTAKAGTVGRFGRPTWPASP